ncbi:hypothetical protein Acsp05_13520 [Actinokineospora sp. NBRC 105648]|nr:hypothetical protein Acsp05_13520 [Actinokineospora sp. NBRC 105648]
MSLRQYPHQVVEYMVSVVGADIAGLLGVGVAWSLGSTPGSVRACPARGEVRVTPTISRSLAKDVLSKIP